MRCSTTSTLYWLTNTAASSGAALLGRTQGQVRHGPRRRENFPVGISIFPKEIVRVPRSWADKVYPNLIHWNELKKGGPLCSF